MQALHEAVRERETKTLEIMRQLQQRRGDATDNGSTTLPRSEPLDVEALWREFGEQQTALVEYTCFDAKLLAFVVTLEDVEVARDLASEEELNHPLRQYRFQIGSLRYGAETPIPRTYDEESAILSRRALRFAAASRQAAQRSAPEKDPPPHSARPNLHH